MAGNVAAPCRICGSTVDRPFLDALQDWEYGNDWHGEIRTCSTCGVTQQYPMLTLEQALAFYPDTYRHYDPGESALRARLMRSYMRRTVSLFRDRLGARAGQRILDIGCADGEKLSILRDRLGLQAVGIEPNARAAQRAREKFGLEVHATTIPTDIVPAASFDFVYLNHVIEHVPDPVELLAFIHTRLKPGGWLVGETENIESPSARLFGRYWALLHMPFHLYFFTRDTLAGVFGRTGFTESHVDTLIEPTAWSLSIQNWLRRGMQPGEKRPPRIPGYVFLTLACVPIAFLEIGRGPILRFVARRPLSP
jgi:SAM-dependent methyltransferase